MDALGTFPIDILINILVRLPAKPLLRFKTVSTAWYHLISNPNFAKQHLNRSLSTQSNLHFIFSKQILHMADFDSFDNAVELDYPFKNPEHGGVSIIGSCHGLLCLWCFGYQDFIVFLFNPTTRTNTMVPFLPIPPHAAHLKHEFFYGFGYDIVTDDYKFVKILKCYRENSESYSELSIYSLKMDSWSRVLDHVPIDFNCRHRDGVLVEENLHWVIDTEHMETPHPIVSFNLNTHTFGEVRVPEVDLDCYYCNMHVGVLDGCLSVIANYLDLSEIYVMKQYGVVESWALLYRIVSTDRVINYERTIAYINNRKELLVKYCHKLLASMNLETMEVERFSGNGRAPRRLDAHVCVENLLLLDCFNDIFETEEQIWGEDDQGPSPR
ncbi:F-box protein CPR1-like [Amaranthus tricolor]|uniref:F-box protein CPR1-like n=1 Tax=Amaranthus tricolor TaxID=29722 RepID=UPI002583EDA4|nr:F-box protein CPR1-like [Amaranthus tricolor]